MNRKYQEISKKIKTQLRNCRDRELRVKAELILLALKLGNVSEACSRRGFSRKFYHKWFNRLKRSKWDIQALGEYSRRPHKSPGQICKQKENAIRWYARRGYGSRMIQAMLKRDGIKVSTTTICHVLNKRRKPVKKRRKLVKAHRRRYELAYPGERLQLDVKYVPEYVEGKRIYNYVAVDECSRWRYARAYKELNAQSTGHFLDCLKAACPFKIECLQTDNGFEFTYRLNPSGQSKEHAMEAWCRENSIRHKLNPPGEKELNGKVERSHRIDEQYFYWRAPTTTLGAFNKALVKWLNEYNTKRPHGGLKYRTPEERLGDFGIKISQQKPKKLSKVEMLLMLDDDKAA